MESKLASFEGSLKVPIVQELAKKKLAFVPSRYVRPDHCLVPRHLPSSLTQIPLIDMQSLFDPNFMDSELDKLHTACKECGFFSPHSDVGGLTILLQVNEIQGLEIKKDGIWVPVSPLPNAFVINFGDIFWSYRSIEHQAIVNAEKERISIATFLNPKRDFELSPSPSLVSLENPQRISTIDYMSGYVSKELDGKSHLDTIRV